MNHKMDRDWGLLPFIVFGGLIMGSVIGYGVNLASPLYEALAAKVTFPQIRF